MSADKFDEEIDALYQHRKKSVKAPAISFEQSRTKPKRRLMEIVPIFTLGACVSLGVFAVIQHLAFFNPETVNSNENQMTYIDVIEIEKPFKQTDVLSMPEHPEVVTRPALIEPPKRDFDMSQSKVAASSDSQSLIIKESNVAILSLVPSEEKVEHRPLYKVMPTYPYSEIRQMGEIKLSYQVSSKGEIIDIDIVKSSVDRGLENSAKNALKQWKYKAGVNHKKVHYVEFQFKK